MTRPAITRHSTMGEVLDLGQRSLDAASSCGATLRPLRSAVSQTEGCQGAVAS